MMANDKKPATKPGVFDVSRPGAQAAPAAASSRAIIIKHQTVQDPMVNSAPSPEPQPANSPGTAPVVSSPSAKKIVIQPLHDHVDDESPKNSDVVISDDEKPVVEPAKQPEPAKLEPVTAKLHEDIVTLEGKPVIDDEAQASERSIKISELVASGTYFLPIETIEQRRNKRTEIIGLLLIIVLALAWYNVALDANLLSNTFNVPHSSFFNAK